MSDQRAARVFGGLFLLTFVTSIAGVLLYGPVLDEKDYILNGSADGRIALGALCEVGLVVTNIGTAVVLFPIARRYHETLALSWVASRIVESTIIAVGAIALLSIVTLNQESSAAAGPLLVQGESLVAVHDWTFLFGPGFCVAIGNGIILGTLMWKSGLVPRRLALLGLIGGPLILIRSILVLFDVVDPGTALDVVVVPEILWEAALGFYPLIKGFHIKPPPVAADWQLRTGDGPRTAAAATG
jgi:hypothetical protein